jgi:hypothetical protein
MQSAPSRIVPNGPSVDLRLCLENEVKRKSLRHVEREKQRLSGRHIRDLRSSTMHGNGVNLIPSSPLETVQRPRQSQDHPSTFSEAFPWALGVAISSTQRNITTSVKTLPSRAVPTSTALIWKAQRFTGTSTKSGHENRIPLTLENTDHCCSCRCPRPESCQSFRDCLGQCRRDQATEHGSERW